MWIHYQVMSAMPDKDGVYIGFDFGTKRIGTAVGQALTGSATPLQTFGAKNGEPDWQKVENLINEWRPQGLVVGIPLNMDGTTQPITDAAHDFAKKLKEKFNLPIYEFDERLSTVEARAHVFEQEGYKGLQKKEIDSVAAKVILESWLAAKS